MATTRKKVSSLVKRHPKSAVCLIYRLTGQQDQTTAKTQQIRLKPVISTDGHVRALVAWGSLEGSILGTQTT